MTESKKIREFEDALNRDNEHFENWVKDVTETRQHLIEARASQAEQGVTEIASLKKQIKDLENSLEPLKADVSTLERRHRTFLNEVTNGVGIYQSRLGLSFSKVEKHGLRFAFTKIDPKDENREFSFTVMLLKSSYDVPFASVYPMVDGYKELLDELHADSDLGKFVRAMRQKFKESVSNVL